MNFENIDGVNKSLVHASDLLKSYPFLRLGVCSRVLGMRRIFLE